MVALPWPTGSRLALLAGGGGVVAAGELRAGGGDRAAWTPTSTMISPAPLCQPLGKQPVSRPGAPLHRLKKPGKDSAAVAAV